MDNLKTGNSYKKIKSAIYCTASSPMEVFTTALNGISLIGEI
ncbi:hypothetical protein SAMN02910431_01879 [Bacteroides sp. AR20]|nr:hypothetical protein SAMN02910431_01879 [Bacteroides sp. AR20]